MSDLETRLEEALRADAAPARDPMFRVQLLARREQAAARRQLARGAAMALAGGVVGSLGLAMLGGLAAPERLAATAAVGTAVAAALAAAHLGAGPVLQTLLARWRATAPLRLW